MNTKTLVVNGVKYVKQGADFQKQTDKVVDLLGVDMYRVLSSCRAIIAGGAVLSTFTNQDVHDVDVYFRSREDLVKAFLEITKDWEGIYLGNSDKSITLKDRDTGAIVQFIYFDYFKDADAVFEAFDFTVCMAAVELNSDEQGDYELVLHPSFLSDMATRTLKFNAGTHFPYISLIRTKKYIERGYVIGKGNLLAIAIACASKPIQTWDEARYQLGGVYGNEIQLEIEQGTEFSQEKLHEIVTRIKDNAPSIYNQDYERLFFELTSYKYGTTPNTVS